MGLGILEPRAQEHVPGQIAGSDETLATSSTISDTLSGTTRYFDDADRPPLQGAADADLKCDTTGKEPIILIPQPSDDPNDPLNWPLWRRDLVTLILCLAAILATALGPILAANTVTIVRLFSETFSRVALLTGYFLLGAGAAAIFCVPSGRIWGKRHLFLIGICIIVASSAWAGSVGSDYGSLVGARIVQGFGTAPFESLINAAVGDLYFVHQRGVRMAFTNLAVFGGAFFTPILVGRITATMGWTWSFYFVSIFMAATLPAVFLLCPETAYRRDARPNIISTTNEEKALPSTPRNAPQQTGLKSGASDDTSRSLETIQVSKKTFWQSLALFDGRKTDDRYWMLLVRPFPLLMNPAFVWACLIQGSMIGWTVFIGVLIAAVFIGPPYFWGEVQAGYTYAGPFIGAICGFIISGLLADSSVRYLTKLNKGIFEPEFRIFLVLPMFVIGGIGLYGFALTASDVVSGRYSYIVPLIFFGFEVAGMVIGTVASSLYIVDAYRELAVEGFTLMIIFKNLFSFVLTFFAYDWLIQDGIRNTLVSIASVQVVICLLSIPMYLYGKRCRAFFYRHDTLSKLGLR